MCACFCFLFSLTMPESFPVLKLLVLPAIQAIYYFLLFFNKPIYPKQPKVVRLKIKQILCSKLQP